MVESIKFSLWEMFTYFLIGLQALVLALIYVIVFYQDMKLDVFSNIDTVQNNFATYAMFTLPFVLLLIGMLIEPLANKVAKVMDTIRYLKPKSRRQTNTLEKEIRLINSEIPSQLKLFRYCKAVVEQNSLSANLNVFLARFGFYRSTSFLFLVLAIAVMLTAPICSLFQIITITSIVFSIFFHKRAQDFLGHMEYEVYFCYLAYKTESKVKE